MVLLIKLLCVWTSVSLAGAHDSGRSEHRVHEHRFLGQQLAASAELPRNRSGFSLEPPSATTAREKVSVPATAAATVVLGEVRRSISAESDAPHHGAAEASAAAPHGEETHGHASRRKDAGPPMTLAEKYTAPALSWLALAMCHTVARWMAVKNGLVDHHRAQLTAAFLVLWSIVLFATGFYALGAHGWSWLECIYFCIVTVTTVGYGDYVPEDSRIDRFLLLFMLWFNVFVLCGILGIAATGVKEVEKKFSGSLTWSARGSEHESESANKIGLLEHVVWLGMLTAFGTLLFMALEGWTFVQALYFVTVTLTTVGYGFLLPNSSAFSMGVACIFILFCVPIAGAITFSLGRQIDDYFTDFKQSLSAPKLLATYIGIVIGWMLTGATIFHFVNSHHWDWPECFYLAAVTMTTVGYGDYVPSATLLDNLTCIIFIWISVIVIAVVLTDMTELLIIQLTTSLNRHSDLLILKSLLAAIICWGVMLSHALEEWGYLNGFVFTSVTCTTVGFGHLKPSTSTSRSFTTAFIMLAVPLTGAVVGHISNEYEAEIKRFVKKLS